MSRTRLLVDSGRSVKDDALKKDYKAYLDNLYPFREAALQSSIVEQKEVMQRWVEAGPVHFTPLVDVSSGAKAKKVLRARGAALQKRQAEQQAAPAPTKLKRAYKHNRPVKLRVPRK